MTLLQVTILPAESSSWSASAVPVNLYVECVGAGGGGAGASANGIGGGGGAGAYTAQYISSASGEFSCSVGAEGLGGLGLPTSLDQNTGSAGGDTFFGVATASAGLVAKGGSGGQGSSAPVGGAGGLASDGTGSFKLDGGPGSPGFKYADRQAHSHAQSGDGASGFFGGGAPGISSNLPNEPSVRDGVAIGAGGSGATSGAGGTGSAGMIRIWEYSG